MTAAADRQKAMAAVLSCIASNLAIATEVLIEAVQAGEEKDALIVACQALIGISGSLADRAARACGDCGCKSADSWIHSPMASDALKLLEGQP